MNSSSFFNADEMMERGKKVLNNQVQTTVQSVKAQVTGQMSQPPSDAGSATPGMPDQMTKDFLQDMYAPSNSNPQSNQSQNAQSIQQMASGGGDPAKIAETRKLLAEHHKQHMEKYYKPTFEVKPQQERPLEKVEREKAEEEQKRWELQKEEKKKEDIALKMATNKAEMFRGAAG